MHHQHHRCPQVSRVMEGCILLHLSPQCRSRARHRSQILWEQSGSSISWLTLGCLLKVARRTPLLR
jgi:hypothetical protein